MVANLTKEAGYLKFIPIKNPALRQAQDDGRGF